ncbi:MAG: hypothetical protein NZ920_01260 [Aigarchaeota archaeon]|nr:hypothetical protein [Aigarchaeota archaeon]MDW8093070.1 hypothetical protein [Nitrososphaerota archaeon]
MIDLGVGQTRNDESGKIAYAVFSAGLDIVGVAVTPPRLITLWDSVVISGYGGPSYALRINNSRSPNNDILFQGQAATNTATLRDSPFFVFRGAWWDGAQSRDLDYMVKIVMTGTGPTARLTFARFINGSDPSPVELVAIASNIGSEETALLLTRNIGGTLSVVRVLLGPPDSGGTGFRVLRVVN